MSRSQNGSERANTLDGAKKQKQAARLVSFHQKPLHPGEFAGIISKDQATTTRFSAKALDPWGFSMYPGEERRHPGCKSISIRFKVLEKMCSSALDFVRHGEVSYDDEL